MNRYTKILEKLGEEFNAEYVAAVLRTTDTESDLPMDILTVSLEEFSPKGNEWIAEYSFLPLKNGADNTAYLSAAITLATDMSGDASDNVAWLISRLNYYAPYGAFSVSDSGEVLAYKLCVPVFDKGDDDELFEKFNLIAAHSLDFVENVGGLVEAVMEYDITPEEAMDQFLGRDE